MLAVHDPPSVFCLVPHVDAAVFEASAVYDLIEDALSQEHHSTPTAPSP